MKLLFKILFFGVFLVSTISFQTTFANEAKSVHFTDIKNHWAEKTIIQAQEANLLKGYEDGTFRPNKTVTRGEFAAFLSRATVQAVTDQLDIPFGDVQTHWSAADVQKDLSLGFIMASDYPNGFSPDKAITRGEIAKWMANGLSSRSQDYKQALVDMKDTYVPVREMFKGALAAKDIPTVGLMVGTGLLTGYTDLSFGLEKNTTRAEVATILLRYMDVENKEPKDFLGLRELREVGTMGTNVTTILPFYYGNPSSGKLDTFKNIMNKPKTTPYNAVKLVLHKLIAIDLSDTKTYTSIYGKMFISDDLIIFKDCYYFFELATVTSNTDKYNAISVYNSLKMLQQESFYLVNSLGKPTKAAINNELPLSPRMDSDKEKLYKKGIPQTVWRGLAIDKKTWWIEGQVDDGSRASIGAIIK